MIAEFEYGYWVGARIYVNKAAISKLARSRGTVAPEAPRPAAKGPVHRWDAQFRLTHESFGGYTHSDGFADVQVRARTEAEAREKARRLVQRQHRGYDCNLVSIGQR